MVAEAGEAFSVQVVEAGEAFSVQVVQVRFVIL